MLKKLLTVTGTILLLAGIAILYTDRVQQCNDVAFLSIYKGEKSMIHSYDIIYKTCMRPGGFNYSWKPESIASKISDIEVEFLTLNRKYK